MSSALTLGCGGESKSKLSGHGSGGSGGARAVGGTAGTGASGGSGLQDGTGGVVLGSGGSAAADGGTGDTPLVDSGGAPEAGAGSGGGTQAGSGGGAGISAAGGAGAFPVGSCNKAQWTCDPLSCAKNGYFRPNACSCDTTRPKSSEDCVPGEIFVCRAGDVSGSSSGGPPELVFDCTCSPNQNDCEATCRDAYGADGRCVSESQTPGDFSILCGCALVLQK